MSTNERCEVSASTATLHDYNTAEPIRAASDDELRGSVHTAERDSGAGVHSPRSRATAGRGDDELAARRRRQVGA